MTDIKVNAAYYKTLVRSHELACELYEAWSGTPFSEPDEADIERKLNRLMAWIKTLDVDEEERVCSDCSGSGMGMTEDSSCRTCRGSGEA